MRNQRELVRIRIENINWTKRLVLVPDSKTEGSIRDVPITDRAFETLKARCEGRRRGSVFVSKRSKSGHLATIAGAFRKVRHKAGLLQEFALYCARHDFGSRLLQHTGNLKLVVEIMGQKDVSAALKYQHPDHELVRTVLNQSDPAHV